MMKAYRANACGIVGIVLTRSAGRARYLTMLAAKDAGYHTLLTDITIRRAAEYDAVLASGRYKAGRLYAPECLPAPTEARG